MDRIELVKAKIKNSGNNIFRELYGSDEVVLREQSERYTNLLERFQNVSALSEPLFFSSPGRTEIGGNHTDHNYGRVLAGAVNLDNVAIAAKNNSGLIRIESEGYQGFTVDLSEPGPDIKEQYTSAALVRGIASRMKELGYKAGGFDAIIDGRVPKGSGLSSSAS